MQNVENAPSRTLFVVLEEGSGQIVRIDQANREKFCVRVNDAIRACKQVSDQIDVCFQIADLQNYLAEWIHERQDRIHSAFVNLQSDGDLRFVIVQQGIERDDVLSQSLVDLDIEIACHPSFDKLRVEVLSLPRTSQHSLTAFLSNGEVRQHANTGSSCEGGKREQENA